MLTEIIIYIALFAALFSGGFAAAFQTVDTVRSLQVQRNAADNLHLFSLRLDSLVQSGVSWESLSFDYINQAIPNAGLSLDSFSSQILDTATSSSKVLFLTMSINGKIHRFSYAKEK